MLYGGVGPIVARLRITQHYSLLHCVVKLASTAFEITQEKRCDAVTALLLSAYLVVA